MQNTVSENPQRARRAARLAMRVALGVAAFALCLPAAAFYPIGGWDTFGTLRIAKWKLSDFDLNNDGVVGPGEGREVQIEGGPAGFTAAEILTLQKSMNTWQSVPTTYASFRVRGIFQDVTIPGSDAASFDAVSSFYMQVTEDEDTGEDVIPDPIILGDVAFPVLGVTVILFSVEETLVEVGGQIVSIPAGTIIDSDIIINAAATRAIGSSTPPYDLEGVMTHELGHFLGLDHPAHSNLRPEPGALGGLVESPVLPYTQGNDGVQRVVGVTPTMFPFSFLVQNELGQRVDGGRDLAPDDISGISWLYPRGSQAAFFDVTQNARTQTRPNSGLPSVPIPGGHVVAWADQDGNPDTPRVPVFGTMTALWEKSLNQGLLGRFRLINLWKQFEIQGSTNLFRTPSYVFTLSPLSGAYPDAEESFIRQMPVGITPDAIDSLHNPSTSSDPPADYITSFNSEVFQEDENLIDISNRDAGTGMVWSFEQNALISTATGRTLPSILRNNAPMFGDPNDVCPLFATEVPAGGGGGTGGGGLAVLGSLGNDRLRAFRDEVLLRSAVGTAFVNSYYRVAPSITTFLLEHDTAFYAFRYTKLGIYWIMENFILVATAVGLLALGALALRRRRVALVATTAMLLLVAGVAQSAHAAQAYQSIEDFVDGASDIVAGRVVEATARWGDKGRIFTDVTVEISSTAKGNAEKANSTITFSVVGGRIDGLAMVASEMPTFKQGEDLVVYLREYKPGKFAVYGGSRGKVNVSTVGDAKIVRVDSLVRQGVEQRKAAKGADKDNADDLPEGTVALNDYLDYLRSLAQDDAAAK